MIRMGSVFAGFYWMGKDDWKRLIACLIGFILARFAVTWLTRQSCGVAKEAGHAP
jgi:F1F0 ATPase subunit 2